MWFLQYLHKNVRKICIHSNTFICVNLLKNIGKFTHWLCKHYTKISVNLHKGNASTATQNLVWNCSLLGFLKPKMAKIDVQSGYSCLRIITGTIWDSSYWSSRSHKYNNSIGNCDWVKTVNVKIPVGVVQDACWRNHLVEPCTTVHPAGPKQQNEL